MIRLSRAFFNRPLLTVARELVGSQFVWLGCGGRVVEVEAYAAEGDPACHLASRPGAREFFRIQPPGVAYVYLNYGMYWLLNVLVRDGIVLIRALEPACGIPTMQSRRNRTALTDLCSGPGKLGRALGLDRSAHGVDLTSDHAPGGFFTAPRIPRSQLVTDVRIGISKATDFPWRFLLKDSPHLSVPAPAPQAKIGTRASRRSTAGA
ncbi:MAG: DNA-3-methyladenine glycosylase [Verrucomicrobiales bacterium]|nr:DNA-3-methyladenine glycosylase [Verrucomicrobiales bacterium]